MIKISVIIPVFNTQHELAQCLESIVSQTMQDIEIIIVDDGSENKPTVKEIIKKKILDNCQTRLVFRTINAQDSRRILKKPGAEDLLGRVEAILYQEGKCRKIQCP